MAPVNQLPSSHVKVTESKGIAKHRSTAVKRQRIKRMKVQPSKKFLKFPNFNQSQPQQRNPFSLFGQRSNQNDPNRREDPDNPFDPKNQMVYDPIYTYSVLEPFEKDTMSGSMPEDRLLNQKLLEVENESQILESNGKIIVI